MAVHIRWGKSLALTFQAKGYVSADRLNDMSEQLCRAAVAFLQDMQNPDGYMCLYNGTTADDLCNLLFDGMERGKMFVVPFYLPVNQQGLIDHDKGFETFNAFLQSNFMQLAFMFGGRDRVAKGVMCRLATLSVRFSEGVSV